MPYLFSEKCAVEDYYTGEAHTMTHTTLSKDELRQRAGIVNIGEAAAMVGIEPRHFRYQLESGAFARPLIRIGTKPRRYYTLDDVEQIRRLFENTHT
jgi:hypothetical protein